MTGSLSAATVSQVEVICHGGLIRDERLPYMVQSQGKAALAYIQKRSRSLIQGL